MSSNVLPFIPPVSRIVDYEPAVVGGPPALPPLSLMPDRATPAPTPPPLPSEQCHKQAQAAATFADAALRRVLEVIDRRRPLTQLRPLLAAGLAESLLSGVHGHQVMARLRRVRAQLTPDGAAEVAAHYTRGQRVHAIACRIEQISTPTGDRWQVVALHLG